MLSRERREDLTSVPRCIPSNVHPQLRFRWRRMLKLCSAEVLLAQHSPPPAFPLEVSWPEPLGKARPMGSGVGDAECGDCLLPHFPSPVQAASAGVGYTCCVPSPRAFGWLEPPPLPALVLLWLVPLIKGGPVPVTSGSSAPSLDAGTSWVSSK